MKRLALSLAAAFLGSGCIVTSEPCNRTITVDWDVPSSGSGFVLADGSVTGCAGAGVDWVEVYMDGSRVGNGFPCSLQGAVITGVGSGTYTLKVEGLEASGRIAFRDQQVVSAGSCGDHFLAAMPAEGTLNIQYSFTPNVCFSAASYMWFSVFDEVAGKVTAAVDASSTGADKVLYACGDPLVFPLPAGTYSLDWIQEMENTAPGIFAVRARNCTATGFTVVGMQTTALPVALVDSSAACF